MQRPCLCVADKRITHAIYGWERELVNITLPFSLSLCFDAAFPERRERGGEGGRTGTRETKGGKQKERLDGVG